MQPSTQGSELIDYNDSNLYDQYRIPIGIEAICNLLTRQKQLTGNTLSILSLCCGTGTNEARLLSSIKNTISTFHFVDFSTTMLDEARQRHSDHSDRLTLSFDALDVLEDTWPGTADCILCFQAIHHFDHNDRGFSNINRFFNKATDYLSKGGQVILTFSTPMQMLEAQWYTAIRADDSANDPTLMYGEEFPPLEFVLGHLNQAGFAVRALQPLEGPYAPLDQFTDSKLLSNRTFQDGDSFFSIARDNGLLKQYLANVHEMVDKDLLESHIARAEARRKEVGIAYLLCAEKL